MAHVATLIAPAEAARRARAAMGYAGLDYDELAAKTGITVGTLRNITSRSRPQSGSIDRLYAVADACGVPRTFMDEGWSRYDGTVEGRLEELKSYLQNVALAVESIATATGVDNQELAGRDALRALVQHDVAQLDTFAGETPTADEPRDESDATREESRARSAGRPSNG